jgi:hypothetical protein
MKLAIALLVGSGLLILFGLLLITTYGCMSGSCPPSPNEIALYGGIALFALAMIRVVQVIWSNARGVGERR